MEISYDADALYIEFQKGEFAKNKKVDDLTIIDLDKDENVLSIEFLDVIEILKTDFLHHKGRDLRHFFKTDF